ncbi:MAG: hypothetical protein ACTSXX_01510 [Candidatus Baldrarchaeia archaeon]
MSFRYGFRLYRNKHAEFCGGSSVIGYGKWRVSGRWYFACSASREKVKFGKIAVLTIVLDKNKFDGVAVVGGGFPTS